MQNGRGSPAAATPLSPSDPRLAGDDVGPGDAAFAVTTGTRVDVGRWFRRERVRVRVLEDQVLLLAPGTRPYVQSVPFGALRESRYNHVTGEVVLAPAEDVKVGTLRMSPLDASRFLALLKQQPA
jgi:hypothetical protein